MRPYLELDVTAVPTMTRQRNIGLKYLSILAVSVSICASVLDVRGVSAANLNLKTVDDQPGIELFSPAFLGNQGKIAVVRKQHEPDGHEAESYSEKELAEFHDRTGKNTRWADPEITIVSIDKSEPPQVVDYGWASASLPDGKTMFYVHQEKPISGFRVLAEPQKGNQVCAFNVDTRSKTVVATPETGYMDAPLVSPDGKLVAYQLCDATNGEWGGSVGVGLYDVAAGKSKTVMAPAKHQELFDLVHPLFWVGNRLIVSRETPLTKGTFLADKYKAEILSIDAAGTVTPIYVRKAEQSMTDESPLRARPASDATTVIVEDENNLVTIEPGDGKVLTTTAVKKNGGSPADAANGISPDRKYTASVEEGHLKITSLTTKKTQRAPVPGEFRELAWSPDSRQIALIVTKEKPKDGVPVFDHDCLMVVTIPADF